MSIIHIKKREHPYVQIDKRCLADTRLSWRARGILAYLLSKPNDWLVSVKDLENKGVEGRDAVQNALKELQRCGYANLETAQDEFGRLLGKRWVVTEEPTNGFSGNGMDTDELKNRPTEKPSNGKSAPTNNDIKTNNENGERGKTLSSSRNLSLEAEKKEKDIAPAPPAGTRTLEPPFSHVATIEPKQPRIVRLHTPELPGVELIEPVPNPIPHTPDPRSRPAETFARVDIADEIAELKSDQLAMETFVMSRKIPVRYFEEYADAFKADVLGRGETYNSRKDFRRHFFSWCGVRYEIDQKKLTKNGASRAHLTPGGANQAVYSEKQKF